MTEFFQMNCRTIYHRHHCAGLSPLKSYDIINRDFNDAEFMKMQTERDAMEDLAMENLAMEDLAMEASKFMAITLMGRARTSMEDKKGLKALRQGRSHELCEQEKSCAMEAITG